MACFLVPAAEAVVVTIVAQVLKNSEHKASATPKSVTGIESIEMDSKIPFSRKLKWLTNLLWGGAFLLAFEHVWHGEVAPWFPFLTAASNPADAATMLHEMSTVGVSMAILVTAVWVGMVLISNAKVKKVLKAQTAAN